MSNIKSILFDELEKEEQMPETVLISESLEWCADLIDEAVDKLEELDLLIIWRHKIDAREVLEELVQSILERQDEV